MDDYVKRRKGNANQGLFKFTFSSSESKSTEVMPKKQQPLMDEGDFTEEEVKMAMQGKLGGKATAPVESGNSKPNFFSRIFGSSKSEDDFEEEQMVEKVKEQVQKAQTNSIPPDVAEVLTIAGKWLNRLDSETKMEFKNSTDYAKYKFLLDRLKNR